MIGLEHPDITRCLETGYPSRLVTRSMVCTCCGDDLSQSCYWFEIGDDAICDSCISNFRKSPAEAIVEAEYD